MGHVFVKSIYEKISKKSLNITKAPWFSRGGNYRIIISHCREDAFEVAMHDILVDRLGYYFVR